MPLLGLLQGMSQDGVWGGLKDYAGNNTQLGQGVNAVGNIYQGMTGAPKSNLIGNAPVNSNNSNPTAPTKDSVIQNVINQQNANSQPPPIQMPDMSKPTLKNGLIGNALNSVVGGII